MPHIGKVRQRVVDQLTLAETHAALWLSNRSSFSYSPTLLPHRYLHLALRVCFLHILDGEVPRLNPQRRGILCCSRNVPVHFCSSRIPVLPSFALRMLCCTALPPTLNMALPTRSHFPLTRRGHINLRSSGRLNTRKVSR